MTFQTSNRFVINVSFGKVPAVEAEECRSPNPTASVGRNNQRALRRMDMNGAMRCAYCTLQ